MKPFLLAAASLLSLTGVRAAQPIETREINPSRPMQIALSPNVMTTLKFPDAVTCISGLGLVDETGQAPGAVQTADVAIRRQANSPFLGLHALSAQAHEVMTVVLGDGNMYVFELKAAPSPDVAITLVKGDGNAAAANATASVAEVVKDRPRQNVELYLSFLDRVRDAAGLMPLRADLYHGYTSLTVDYPSEGDLWKTDVTGVHSFPDDDVMVLKGTVTNKTQHPMTFDSSAVAVQAGNELHAAKLVRVKQPLEAGEEAPIEVLIQGEPNGVAAANLDPSNQFLIYLPQTFGTVAGGVWNPARSTAGVSTAKPNH